MTQKIVKAIVEGGKATPSPPLGPALSQFKVNIGKVIQDINEKTKEYEGMKVPVKIIVDDETKEYRIEVGTPPVSSLIKKELGLTVIGEEKKTPTETTEEKKEEKPKEKTIEKKERVIVGDLTIDQCIKIMKMKRDSLLAKDPRKALKEIVGGVVSMPLTIEGKNPKEILKEIDEGKYDKNLGIS